MQGKDFFVMFFGWGKDFFKKLLVNISSAVPLINNVQSLNAFQMHLLFLERNSKIFLDI